MINQDEKEACKEALSKANVRVRNLTIGSVLVKISIGISIISVVDPILVNTPVLVGGILMGAHYVIKENIEEQKLLIKKLNEKE